jgi:hypothetical protein
MRTMRRAALCAAGLIAVGGGVAVGSDQADELVPANIVIVKTGKLAKFVGKPANAELPAIPDNDPTLEGATLRLLDTDDPLMSDTYDLPAARWKGLGPNGSKGFKYKGSKAAGDPCVVVIVKPKLVKAVCKGADVALATPVSGNLGIVLTVGTDSKKYCVTATPPFVKNVAGNFKAKQVAAPAACASPSGAFLEAAGLL